MLATSPSSDATVGGRQPSAEDFAVHAVVDITAVLRRLLDEEVPVQLSTAEGVTQQTALWAEDLVGNLLVFSADDTSAAVQQLAALGRATAKAELDNVDIIFELPRLTLVRGRDTCAFNAPYPTQILRLQRRDAYRVRPLDFSQPVLCCQHPSEPSLALRLPVLDVSQRGVALRLPDDVPALPMGSRLEATLELDHASAVRLVLCVVRAAGSSAQLGCEIISVAPQDARALQRYIDHTQRRQRMLVL